MSTDPVPTQATIEDALVTWIAAGAGISEDNVSWTQERGPGTKGCYIAITLGGEVEVGGDWTEVRDLAAEDRAPGADVAIVLKGPRTRSLKLECFAGGDPWVTARPEAKLARALKARNLPSHSQALRAAGVGFGPIGPVTVQGIERSKIFESRAIVEMTLHVVSEISELGTWIERVEITPILNINPTAEAIELGTIVEPPLLTIGWSPGFSGGFGDTGP